MALFWHWSAQFVIVFFFFKLIKLIQIVKDSDFYQSAALESEIDNEFEPKSKNNRKNHLKPYRPSLESLVTVGYNQASQTMAPPSFFNFNKFDDF